MSDQVIGTCNLCSGPVTVPTVWMSVNPPVPSCKRCHATPKQAHGRVIEMEPAQPLGRDEFPTLQTLQVFDPPVEMKPGSYTLAVELGDQKWQMPEVVFPRDSSG